MHSLEYCIGLEHMYHNLLKRILHYIIYRNCCMNKSYSLKLSRLKLLILQHSIRLLKHIHCCMHCKVPFESWSLNHKKMNSFDNWWHWKDKSMDDKFWLDLKIHLMGNFPIDILVYIVHMIVVSCKIDSSDHYSHNQQLDKFYLMK